MPACEMNNNVYKGEGGRKQGHNKRTKDNVVKDGGREGGNVCIRGIAQDVAVCWLGKEIMIQVCVKRPRTWTKELSKDKHRYEKDEKLER